MSQKRLGGPTEGEAMSAVRLVTRAAIASAFGFTLVPVLGAGPAFACSCIGGTEQQHYQRADVVFKGIVGKVERATDRSANRVYVFTPSKTYKGETSKPQKVSTSRQSSACGVELNGSGPFLVFAYRAQDAGPKVPLATSVCSGTRKIEPGEKPDFKVDKATQAEARTYPFSVKPADDAASAPDFDSDNSVSSEDVPVAAPVAAGDTPRVLQTTTTATAAGAAAESTQAADSDDDKIWIPAVAAAAALGVAALVGTGLAARRRRT